MGETRVKMNLMKQKISQDLQQMKEEVSSYSNETKDHYHLTKQPNPVIPVDE